MMSPAHYYALITYTYPYHLHINVKILGLQP